MIVSFGLGDEQATGTTDVVTVSENYDWDITQFQVEWELTE